MKFAHTSASRYTLPTLLAVALGLSTAACSKSEDKAASKTENGVRVIKIATAAESKPLSWGAIGVEPQGYEPEVLKAINAKLPQYKFVMEGAADIAQETGIATGKYDMATGGYFKAPEREKQFLIPSNPMGASLMKIYSRSDSNINEVKDLVGKKVVPVSAGGGVYKFITKWQEQNPDYKINITASSAGIPYPDRLKEVQNGKYDALVLPSNLGEQTVIENQKLAIKSSEPVSIDNTYILIHKSAENQVLSDDINKVLKELKDDGTLSKISQKWFGEDVMKYVK
ncbi:transporter substrate-binding domain-containing protein [Vitreoscilla massiliensis]|uniref:Transporter substrate-binding domain-containing protein n=1 Tax=Vitreoscilla massiliensis TaxID=1689272 RepID=A0ABY4E0I5_9NEIS|nr:transporter substrate-binding domain-containing protein [Vitreoscilla massiliensis]UOO89057.1 transporter substrate-binding domain-containing protein [Vitreoscilla massiliensis]